MTLRHPRLDELPFLVEICHQTGFGGRDASPVVSDRRLLGQYFAAPYLVRDADWCWVACDEAGVAGYLVATPDTQGFSAWMEAQWLPKVRQAFPQREDPTWSPTEAWIRRTIHSSVTVPDFVDDYPAHLHVDLLPRAQGQGLGGRLFEAFQDQLQGCRIPGFHLGVSEENTRAQAFYAKQGLQRIRHDPGVFFLGRRL